MQPGRGGGGRDTCLGFRQFSEGVLGFRDCRWYEDVSGYAKQQHMRSSSRLLYMAIVGHPKQSHRDLALISKLRGIVLSRGTVLYHEAVRTVIFLHHVCVSRIMICSIASIMGKAST